MADRPIRPCNGCTVTDDHPRHIIAAISVGGRPRPPEIWHLDCHAAAGCVAGTTPPGEPSCAERLEGSGHRHGKELAAHFAALRSEVNG